MKYNIAQQKYSTRLYTLLIKKIPLNYYVIAENAYIHLYMYWNSKLHACTIDQKPFGICRSAKIYVYVDFIQLHCKKNQLSMITLYKYIFSKKP